MARVLGRLASPVAVLLGAVALLLSSPVLVPASAATSSGGTSSSATQPSWSTLQGQALRAVAGVRAAGSLAPASSFGPVRTGTVTTASGPVSVEQRTLVASDNSGPVVVVLAWLGGTQLVVTEMDPWSPSSGQALVLAPGTDRVQGRYPLVRSQGLATAQGTTRGTNAVLASVVTHRSEARLASTYGCSGHPLAPEVIGSVYGPLIQGTGVISCPLPETLGLIVGLYERSSELSTTSGGTYGTYYALNVYHACSLISGTNPFKTAQLWSVNGSLYGSTSATSYLDCA